jgi:hypothetical protein
MPITFDLDESMPKAVAEGRRRQGIDVTTSVDAKLLEASDEMQLEHAVREGRVLVTRDQDFLGIHAKNSNHSGTVDWNWRRRSIGKLIGSLSTLIVEFSQEDLKGCLIFF